MKNSGVEWIGEIPVDWDILPTKRFFRNVKRVAGKDVDNFERLALTLNGVIKRSKTDNEGLQPEQFESYQILKENEMVFKLIDLENVKTSRVGLSSYTGLVSPAYIVLTNDNTDNRFYYYWFISMYYNEVFNRLGGAGVRSALNAKDLLNIPAPNLNESERKSIADFLDEKCAKIDAVIEKQKQVIEKLKEYKLSVITEAVTKGLDPTVPMKDSGVEWIGEMPENWSLIKAKNAVSITNGQDPTTEGDIPVYGSGAASFKTCGEYKVGPTVLIGRKGATLHIPHYIAGKYWNVDTAFDVHIKDGVEFNLKFYYYLAVCFDYKCYISATTLPSMTQSIYNNMFITNPLLSEQKQIVEYLDNKCIEIDSVIARKQAIVEKLTEYKKSLIYEVVTGKREV